MVFILYLLLLFIKLDINICVNISLDGNDWFATNSNNSIKVSARVPGSIFTDLMRNGLIDDPYIGYNDINYKWISRDNWTYEKSFNVDNTILNNRGVYLVCHGLDTVSQVFINGNQIGATDNMFVRYKFDIKDILKPGLNTIKIRFESAVTYAKQKHDDYVKTNYAIPPECTKDVQNGECHPNFIRKMQASFSWDWGPSFPTQGIWKHLDIETYNTSIIRDITIDTLQSNNHWILNTSLYLESTTNTTFDAKLQFSIFNDTIFTINHKFVPLSDGSLTYNLQIPVNNSIAISRWYPNGVSTQTLYQLTVTLLTNEESFSKTIRIGFRTIELIEDSVEPTGSTFYFKVNGIAMFAKGSNWIPAHVFPELLTNDYIRKLLESARDANMNFLRVWGGGVYESNYFYEVADELGILIWQDFMYACALYPTDEQFFKSVATETVQQVRRLQHHPSIAIWAGNNENEAAIAQFWWPEVIVRQETYKSDYVKLYINTIREIVINEDTSRPFVSSSPSNGLESIKEGWIAKNPQDTRFGDVHYYNYGINAWDWKIYPSAKFASEYGFQSYPSLESFSTVINSTEWTYPVSNSVVHRQHHLDGNQEMQNLIDNYLKLPVNGGRDRFEDIIYLSQISQAMSIKTETEFYRRNRDLNSQTGDGYTMGALYWQLNDIWQAPTWASIEFGGKWKMLHYFAKNMFTNLVVIPYEDDNEMLKVAVVRDDYSGLLSFNLTVSVFKWSSLEPLQQIKQTINTSNFSSQIVYQNSITKILNSSNCVNRKQCLFEVNVENIDKQLNASNFMFLSPLKLAEGMIRPKLQVNVSGPAVSPLNYVYDIVLETDAISPFVWLDFKLNSNIKGTFSDNGFIMFENKRNVKFYSETSIAINTLRENIYVKSLTDVKTQ